MRTRPRALLAAAAAAFTLTASAVLAPTAGAATHHQGAPVGGPRLVGAGVIEDPGPHAPALPRPSQLPATSWLVANLTTGQILATKGPHLRLRPASTLKVLTALTLLPRLNPASEVKTTEADEAVGGSMVGLQPGRDYTVEQLFTAMLVVSANDAATALASANHGVGPTVAEMNEQAHLLQADDTHAGSVDGLDAPGQFSSAYDLALIARAALQLPAFRHYVGTESAYIPYGRHKHFEIQSHNPLLGVYPGTFGVKNGYTVEDHATYIGAARHGNTTILVTLMHAYPDFTPMAEALLNWGFAANTKVTPVGQLVAPLASAHRPSSAKAAAAVSRHDAAGQVSVHNGSGDTLEEVGLGILVALVLLAVVRLRARRRRRGRRLSLPRF